MPAAYDFLVRSPTTLEVLGELPAPDVWGKWTRRDVDAGSFSLTVPLASLEKVSFSDIDNVIEITRDGAFEFAGVIGSHRLFDGGRMLELKGDDLLGFWLSKREVGRTAADAKSDAAETIVKAYVDENIGPGASSDRQAGLELAGNRTWTVQPDGALGTSISWEVRRQSLIGVASQICRAGEITQDVVMLDDRSGYEYRTARPTDRTKGNGGTEFSWGLDNAEGLEFTRDYRRTVTNLNVLGDGSGDLRNTTEVDISALTGVPADYSRFRREGSYDARTASTSAERTDVGEAELRRHLSTAIVVKATPARSRTDPGEFATGAAYRTDWDVGYDVTLLIPEMSVDEDRRIVSATVTLSGAQGEEIGFELGTHRAASQLRRIEDAIGQLRVAAVA